METNNKKEAIEQTKSNDIICYFIIFIYIISFNFFFIIIKIYMIIFFIFFFSINKYARFIINWFYYYFNC